MKTLLLFFAGIFSIVSFAQDGSLDTSFGDNGIVRTDIDGDYDFPTSLVQQPDENLVVAGSFTNGSHRFPSIVRYFPDGSQDISFGNNGLVVYDVPEYENQYYEKVLSQSDGKILVGANYHPPVGYVYSVHRFLDDGSLDSDYGNNGEVIIFSENVFLGDMILQNDDSLIVAVGFRENDTNILVLRRLLPDGSLDVDFGNNGTVTTPFEVSQFQLLITNNEQIIVLTGNNYLLRFNGDGTMDNDFGTNGIAPIAIDQQYISTNMTIYNDGKIAVQSGYIDNQSSTSHNIISRYLSNGDLDTSFGNDGYLNPNINNLVIFKILAQHNQRLLTYGNLLADFQEFGGPTFMNRYTVNGNIDATFNFESSPELYYQTDMLLQQNGKIVCLMTTPWYVGNEDVIMKRYFNDPLSVPEFQNQKTIIYPNPSNGIFTIESNFYSDKETYQITDITGKTIASGELGDKQTQIDLSSAQSGVYFLKTSNGVFRLLKN